MADINYVFILSLSIIFLGFLLKQLKIVSEDGGKVLAKIILNLTLPCLILTVIPEIEISISLIFLPILCVIYSFTVLIISYFLFKKAENQVKGLILMAVIGFNIGLFAYPLIEGVWGEEGLKHIALFDIGNAFIVFGVCYIVGAKFSPKNESIGQEFNTEYILKSLLKSVPLISYIIALILNLLGLILPGILFDIADTLATANMPLTLLLLGIFLNFKFEKSEWNTIFKVLIIRYGFGLLFGVILFLILPYDLMYRGSVLVGLILPIGMIVIPYSIDFEYNSKLAGSIVNLTIIISFALMWIMVIFLGIT